MMLKMLKGWICLVVLCLLSQRISGAPTIQDFLDTLLTGYDKRIRPHDSTPTSVSFDIFISTISSVNENAMDYTISVFFRQRWNDPRLKYTAYSTPITLGYSRAGELWVPDTFFPNEKKANSHSITVPNKLLRIHPNGDVLYSQRLSLTLSCNMDLHYFPLDKQKCQIKAETYGYTTNEMAFIWYDKEAIQIDPSTKQLPEFTLVDKETKLGNCTQVYITGTYSCLYVQLSLKREIMFYVSQTFIPSILIVCLSFVSFFIDVRAVPARVSLGLITILTITTMNAGITQTLPRVAYTKAIDVWMAVCLVFVVGALLEYAIANSKARNEDRAKAAAKEKEQKEGVVSAFAQKFKASAKVSPGSDNEAKDDPPQSNGEAPKPEGKKKKWTCADIKAMTSEQVENFSKIFFPVAFIVFNIVFWCFYGISSAQL